MGEQLEPQAIAGLMIGGIAVLLLAGVVVGTLWVIGWL